MVNVEKFKAVLDYFADSEIPTSEARQTLQCAAAILDTRERHEAKHAKPERKKRSDAGTKRGDAQGKLTEQS